MEKPNLTHAIEGSTHAIFAGSLYAIGEYVAHHQGMVIFMILPFGGIAVIWVCHRPIFMVVKAQVAKRRKRKKYGLRPHEVAVPFGEPNVKQRGLAEESCRAIYNDILNDIDK